MHDVPVLREAAEHVPHALLQRVQLRLDQNLGHQMFAGKLDQPCASNFFYFFKKMTYLELSHKQIKHSDWLKLVM